MYAQSVDGKEGLKVTTSLVGKFAISATFTIMFVYSAELFSTDVRSVILYKLYYKECWLLVHILQVIAGL